MILQAFVAPIPAFLITGANGVVFGLVGGTIISWSGAMLGAAGTFYLARSLGMGFVQRWFQKNNSIIVKVQEISTEHGMKVILIGRLIPFISFDFLSYAAGLSNIRFLDFLIATGIGMLPGTVLYVFLGDHIFTLSRYSDSLTILITVGIGIYIIYHFMKKNRIKG
ncbi:TVP38/TMEM64 family protein [Serpentinicella alkaliphila]|nr:TVP38/TMEM64 family protein [Serpentinicella alkaliphila]QUH24586.1 TVP38/TMEM64 family protein [Serpentinicella alkaliphila]